MVSWGRYTGASSILADSRIFCSSAPCRETMLRPRKRLAAAAKPDRKGPAGKCTTTQNSGEASTEVQNSSPQKASTANNGGENLSNHWLMKSEPESHLEKGVDVRFSTEDLKAQPTQTACCDGVCLCQAQNSQRREAGGRCLLLS